MNNNIFCLQFSETWDEVPAKNVSNEQLFGANATQGSLRGSAHSMKDNNIFCLQFSGTWDEVPAKNVIFALDDKGVSETPIEKDPTNLMRLIPS